MRNDVVWRRKTLPSWPFTNLTLLTATFVEVVVFFLWRIWPHRNSFDVMRRGLSLNFILTISIGHYWGERGEFLLGQNSGLPVITQHQIVYSPYTKWACTFEYGENAHAIPSLSRFAELLVLYQTRQALKETNDLKNNTSWLLLHQVLAVFCNFCIHPKGSAAHLGWDCPS